MIASFLIEPLHRLIGRPVEARLDSEELEALIDLSLRQGVIDRDEETLLREVVSFRTLRVRDIMTPRVSVLSVGIQDQPAAIRDLIAESGLQRVPLHAENLDEIIGILPVPPVSPRRRRRHTGPRSIAFALSICSLCSRDGLGGTTAGEIPR